MRKLGLWGGCALVLLALGLSAAAVAAPPPDDDDDDGGRPAAGPNPAARPRDGWNPFITRLLASEEKKPKPKPDKVRQKPAEEPAPRTSGLADTAARYRALEDGRLRRRQDVCERLRQIAYETHDEELERKAVQLDQLAFEVFQQRTLRLASPTAEARRGDDKTDSDSTAAVREVRP
jgi:hypothetical protein